MTEAFIESRGDMKLASGVKTGGET